MTLSRRAFLAGGAGFVLAACSGDGDGDGATPSTSASTSDAATTSVASSTTAPPSTTTTTAPYAGRSDPFTLGVASGDPLPDSVVLWTRLLPAGEALTDDAVVRVEVARDQGFTDVIIETDAVAARDDAHAVHVIADGLDAASSYWYRFRAGSFTSPIGRTRTTPAPGAAVASTVVGSASCQNFEDGWYVAHRDIAASELDVLFWLGDYIYEGGGQEIGPAGVRTHASAAVETLEGYRARYALYKADPDLQAAHAACPWVVIWDDHEVENNYAADISSNPTIAPEAFRARRAAAYRAWWEHMPVRLDRPTGADYRIHRSLRIGDLVDVSLLDTRQHRADQACGDITLSLEPPCAEVFEPARSMLGDEQEAWLLERLRGSTSTWNVIAQQVILGNTTLEGAVLNFDQWDGYPVARDRLLQAVADAAVPNLVVLTGDIHLAAVGRVRAPAGPPIGVELVATSISSSGNVDPSLTPVLAALPDVVDAELAHRGWIKHTVTPERWRADYRIVDDVRSLDSGVGTYASYEVAVGSPEVARLT